MGMRWLRWGEEGWLEWRGEWWLYRRGRWGVVCRGGGRLSPKFESKRVEGRGRVYQVRVGGDLLCFTFAGRRQLAARVPAVQGFQEPSAPEVKASCTLIPYLTSDHISYTSYLVSHTTSMRYKTTHHTSHTSHLILHIDSCLVPHASCHTPHCILYITRHTPHASCHTPYTRRRIPHPFPI